MNSHKRQTRIPSARTTSTSNEQNEDQQRRKGKQRPATTTKGGGSNIRKPPGQTKASLKRQELALSKRLEHTRFVTCTCFI